ncbi:hypothetical protein [Myceligenerans pegani]|uniref:Uncharacterized protein n=1 Tax=Myceligenerans pegani TaxID=2776917 RepID=A0ABR9N3Z6_9MICO|nr:hypothetical protein [Myceligenerans sp. TRM 65318]MBE1878387.1 hypothetical protein [Myceligenerans sp. TRM 65318]MBE3020658.1 hypothetical protein [Myceligenerans sp. TRM 65318]
MTPSSTRHAITDALQGVSGTRLYRNNAFRITGLPPDASTRQVNRRRRESRSAHDIPPPPSPGAPLEPSTDAVALRGAFEALDSPVARFVHELLWLAPHGQDADTTRDDAIRAHCAAVEATDRDGGVDDASTWQLWERALRLWHSALTAPDTWRRAENRVREIDDPRLSVDAVPELRKALTEHIARVSVALAARAADAGDVGSAERHLNLLSASPFPAATIERAARDVAGPHVDRVHEVCEEARSRDPADGIRAASDVLERAGHPLELVRLLLGDDDPVAQKCRDDVAGIINASVVQAMDGPGRGSPREGLRLLEAARSIVASKEGAGVIDRNIAALRLAGSGRLAGRGTPSPGGGSGCLPVLGLGAIVAGIVAAGVSGNVPALVALIVVAIIALTAGFAF